MGLAYFHGIMKKNLQIFRGHISPGSATMHLSKMLICFGLLLTGAAFPASSQSLSKEASNETGDDSLLIRRIFDHSLTHSNAYPNLYELCTTIGPRLSGSKGAARAVVWAQNKMLNMGLDSVWLQPVMVPHWERGPVEKAVLLREGQVDVPVPVCALGGSVGTNGIVKAGVVEVFRFEDLARLGREKIEGRIVFYNRPMEARLINTFDAYSGCVDQRSSGASEASRYGAVAVLVRSMNLRMDDLPHTGVQGYNQVQDSIPAAAISTNAAAMLSGALRKDPNLQISLELSCQNYPDVESYNVIGEIRGTEQPEQIILVGGHLDSWDLGQGAHDDGAGCVQSMAILENMVQLGIRPRHTVRCVLFMNEENGSRGAKRYAQQALERGEIHVAALESDRGGFSPRGFAVEGIEGIEQTALARLREWIDVMAPYGIHFADIGHSGVDIAYLKDQGTALFGLVPDSQRYFDHHHAANDRIEAVNKRELELGAAAMTTWLYLVDRYGIMAKIPVQGKG